MNIPTKTTHNSKTKGETRVKKIVLEFILSDTLLAETLGETKSKKTIEIENTDHKNVKGKINMTLILFNQHDLRTRNFV